MKSKVALSLLFILFLFSCEKEEQYDVIYPGYYHTISGDTTSKIWLIDYYVSFDSTSIDY